MVRMIHVSAFREISASDRWGTTRLAPLTLVLLGFLQPAVALADDVLPQSGSVAQGNVVITTPMAGNMVLNQSSDRAVVNWGSFSIGQGNSVAIHQPSTSSAILNRVTGNTTSQIHGQLSATGQVFVVNPNGLFIGEQGTVNAGGGFVGSTLDTTDSDFMAGQLRFEGLGSSAPVQNAGRVTIGRGGFAALLGGRVTNSGIVTVPMGRVGFAAGELVTLDVSGDQFLQVAVPSQGDTDEMRALIENSGTVSANGGQIEMRAATARDAARNAINLTGVAEARSVTVRGGQIILGGGAGGTVRVSGKVTTRARTPRRPRIIVTESARPNARPGGAIAITGRNIALQGAHIATGGNGDGGAINIGGAFQGGGTLPSALYLGVDVETVITADAGQAGEGGRVILWSDIRTDFAGQISARGGTVGGDGGFVEVSGKRTLAFSGEVDTRAPQGATGTLLLDPHNLTIAEDASSGIADVGDGTIEYAANEDDAILSVDLLERNLLSNNVTVSTPDDGEPTDTQNGNITVASEINWDSDSILTFLADGDVILNAGVDGVLGAFEISAGGVITTGADGFVNVGRFNLAEGDWVQIGGAIPEFNATDFRIAQNVDTSFLRAERGDGTAADPYQLTDIYGVQGIGSQSLLDQSFALGSNIDATGTAVWNGSEGFTPIEGLGFSGFSGSLDGQGNTITGLTMNKSGAGMFALTNAGAEISNLNLSEVSMTGTGTMGALAALAINTTIDNVAVDGALGVSFPETVGGIVGELRGARSVLSNSSYTGTIATTNNTDLAFSLGGLVGASAGTVDNSSFDGTIIERGLTLSLRSVGGGVGTNRGIVSNVTTAGDMQIEGTGGTLRLGGLVGDNRSFEGIAGSESNIAVGVVNPTDDEIHAGGLTGWNIGSITDSRSTSSVTVSSGSEVLSIGGLIGFNNNSPVRPVEGVAASGAVTVTGTAADNGGTAHVGGLVGENVGTIAQGAASGDVYVFAGLTQFSVGGFAGANNQSESAGELSSSIASGSVELVSEYGGSVGGFVGENGGSITDAVATGDVEFAVPLPEAGPLNRAYVGGFAGLNAGIAERTVARGNVSAATSLTNADVGGHTGYNIFATILDSYANGDVRLASNVDGTVGGLVGTTAEGDITNTYASGAVSTLGGGGDSSFALAAGGLIGQNIDDGELAPTTVTASYWDTVASGQADGGDLTLGFGLTTDQLEATASFFEFAQAQGWSFDTVWAPGAAGRYPSIYTVDRVVFARPDALELTYGQTTDATATGIVAGGPELYVFAEVAETLDTTPVFTTLTFNDNLVGAQTFAVDTSPLSSSRLQEYSVVALEGAAVIIPAPLTLTANDATKTYGTALAFDGTEFLAEGLLLDDTVALVALDSDGAAADASAIGSPYDIVIEEVVESEGLPNYDITFVNGALTVSGLVTTPIPSPLPNVTLPQPADTIVLTLPDDSTQPAGTGTAQASSSASLGQATETLADVRQIATTLEIAAAACDDGSDNVDQYLACLTDALDDFADELDDISTDLPPGLQDVARIVRDARQNVENARLRARSRLATATSDAEREAILRDAVGEARVALSAAATDIRKAITFVRADDPELAAVQRATITTVASAIDNVSIELSRAVGL